MSKSVGKSVIRVDAYEKATGRAKYMDDLCDRSALIAKICHCPRLCEVCGRLGGGGRSRRGEGSDLF